MNKHVSVLKAFSVVVPMALSLLAVLPASAQQSADAEAYANGQIIVMAPGNMGMAQPEIDPAAINLLQKNSKRKKNLTLETLDETRDRKFQMALRLLLDDPKLVHEIRRAGEIYDIDPIHIAGAIVGEHTYNVGRTDSLQTYAVNVASWAGKWALRFSASGFPLSDLIELPEFQKCRKLGSDYKMWNCTTSVWESSFRGKTAYGYTFQARSLRMSFFNPIASGFTYGIGQLDPLRALMVNDMVHANSGLPLLTLEDPVAIYSAIIEPFSTIHYMAANLKMIMTTYYERAHFDISHNIGLTSTLYNLGREIQRAGDLTGSNLNLIKTGQLRYPRVNFYGWFVNDREEQIRIALDSVP